MFPKYNIYIVMLVLMMLGGCTASQTGDIKGRQDRLAPGLRVLYFNGMFRNVRQIPDGDTAILEKGRPGPPILIINHQFGGGEIFDSGRSRGVGVQMKGYLFLDSKGLYEFQALSNDGVEVIIDGNSILRDSTIHSDRLSEIGRLSVEKAGWHTLMVKYFQRKGSAALRLYWKPPGNNQFEVIPAKAYGHLPDNSENK